MTGYGLSMRSKKLSEVPYIIFSTTTPMEYFTYLESLGHNSLTRPTFYHTPGVQHDLTKFSHRLKYLLNVPSITLESTISVNYKEQHIICSIIISLFYILFRNYLHSFRVIFVFNGDDKPIRNIKDHIKVVRWAPQKAVLAHKNTKLYITHGGLKSLKETICSDVPALFMPLFAEQSMNAEMARSMGFAEVLVKTNFTMEDFVNKMKLMLGFTLLENPSYLQTISRFHNMMLDRVVSSKDLLVFYARRAIKLGSNVQKFKRKGQFLPLIDHLYIIAISFYGFLIYLCST
uniref:UDP-glucuronosyltransferase n=1 Tax=Heterorhabditis bacteriophora TaxID=37862 RepID=A0A1I7XUT8_HETBA